jgi:hypothetical protein
VILGDRKFGSVKLARWLCEKNVRFVLRVKQGRYIQKEGEEFKRLSDSGLVPEAFILGELKSQSKKDLLSLILPVIGAANIELVVKMKAGICSQI